MVGLQTIILVGFTVFDPSLSRESIKIVDGEAVRSIECRHDCMMFFLVKLVLQAGMVVIGCCLAYHTRNIKEEYSESKHLIFAV